MFDNLGLTEFQQRLLTTAVLLLALLTLWLRVRTGRLQSDRTGEVWFDRVKNSQAFWVAVALLVAADLGLILITWMPELLPT